MEQELKQGGGMCREGVPAWIFCIFYADFQISTAFTTRNVLLLFPLNKQCQIKPSILMLSGLNVIFAESCHNH